MSYDLRKVRDYNNLYKAIATFPDIQKVLESLWVIKTNKNAIEVRDFLAQHMDWDDGLFVVKSWVEGAWRNVLCSSEWLKTNL
jgi:hypothetical protein